MTSSEHSDEHEQQNNGERPNDKRSVNAPMSDKGARQALEHGDNEKIDRALDELDVSTTRSGKDQSQKPDTEGSNSSSKNIDEQDE